MKTFRLAFVLVLAATAAFAARTPAPAPAQAVTNPCITRCLTSIPDPECCAWLCHPVGENPC